jgi:hypothetical protein
MKQFQFHKEGIQGPGQVRFCVRRLANFPEDRDDALQFVRVDGARPDGDPQPMPAVRWWLLY